MLLAPAFHEGIKDRLREMAFVALDAEATFLDSASQQSKRIRLRHKDRRGEDKLVNGAPRKNRMEASCYI
jgi:hypothetical protein